MASRSHLHPTPLQHTKHRCLSDAEVSRDVASASALAVHDLNLGLLQLVQTCTLWSHPLVILSASGRR